MTASELQALCNRTGTWTVSGLSVQIKTVDARKAYGRVDVRITPVAGTGQAWVDIQFVKLDP